MIYDDLNGCTHDELLLLIDKLREKLTAANDRLVLLEVEADCQFMYVCENDEKFEILLTKNEKTISLVDALFCEFNKIKSNLPSSIFSEVNRLETVFRDLYPDREVLPW